MKTRFRKMLSLALAMLFALSAVPFAALPAGVAAASAAGVIRAVPSAVNCPHTEITYVNNGDYTHTGVCEACGAQITEMHQPLDGRIEGTSADAHYTYCGKCYSHVWIPHDQEAVNRTVTGTCVTRTRVYYNCSFCGYKNTGYRDFDTVPDRHLNTVDVPETSSTCIAHGYTAGTYCNDCETWVSGHEAKDLAEHSWQEIEKVKATCSSEGYILWGCAVKSCGATKRETLDVDPDAHSFGIRIHPATCTDVGYTAHACTLCRYGYTTDEQPALGHEWSDPTWKWNGTASAKAVFACTRCGDTQSVPAAITSEIVKAPTETEKGKNVYTATVEFEGETYTDAVEKTIPALNDGLCKWCGERHDGSFWQRIVGFFHNILYFFAHLFGRR